MGKSHSRFKVAFEDYYLSKRLAGDEQLEENLRYYEELEKEKLKVLLLGTAGVGKSTFLRQLRMIHGDADTDEELVDFVSTIHMNLMTSMKILIQQSKRLRISGKIKSQQSLEMIDHYSSNASFLTDVLLTAIAQLWSDPVIKNVWNLREEYVIDQGAALLLDKCQVIATPGYVPESTDTLQCYIPTAGVKTKLYDVLGTMFEINDVGFKRNSKTECVQLFSSAKAFIFIVDLTHFDQTTQGEKKRKNKMVESIEHFGSISSNRMVDDSSVILLLNKIDLLEQKLRHKKIRDVPSFSEYRGSEMSSADAVTYFLEKFTSQLKPDRAREVHHFVTNLLNTEEASQVTAKIKIIIESKIKESEGRSQEIVKITRKPVIKEAGSATIFTSNNCLKQTPLRGNHLLKPLRKNKMRLSIGSLNLRAFTTELHSSSCSQMSPSQDQATQSVSIFSQNDSHL